MTISLPPALAAGIISQAKKQHMTRSEYLRMALRRHLEEQRLDEAIRIFREEEKSGKLKELKGSLVDLMRA